MQNETPTKSVASTRPGTDARTLEGLRAEALTRYRTRCLWNVKDHPSDVTIIDRLRIYGDLAAARLADAMEEARERPDGRTADDAFR